MKYKVNLNPLHCICLQGSHVMGWEERCKEAYYKCKSIEEFTKFVKKEWELSGWSIPKENKPFPQLHSADFFGSDISVEIYNLRGENHEMKFTYRELAEELYYCIDNDII